MRIESLTLERYGAFSGRTLQFRADAALHVVIGANEAGKTSALAAITDLLFGFRHVTPYDFLHETRTLRVGGTFRRADGSALVVRRRKGTKNTLVDAADQPLQDDPLAPLLGSTTREIFESEFGLTSQALRDGGNELLKAGGRLAETLTASSAGLTSLSRLGKLLGDEADALFTPRKSAGKSFYIAAERHADAERRLRDSIVTADAMLASEKAVADAEAGLAALTTEHTVTGSALAQLQRAARTWSKLARLDGLARDIAAFADLPAVPPEAVTRWQDALASDAVIAAELAKLADADAKDIAAVSALAVDEAVLSAGTTIDALRERIGAVRKALVDLPRRRAARRAAQDTLDDAASRLGLASHDALLARLPTDPAMARVRELIVSGQRNAERRVAAEEARHRALQERDRLAAASEAEAADPESFRQRLEALAEVPTNADYLRREEASCGVEERSLAEVAATLDPAGGNSDALALLPMPDEETIAAQARLAEAIERDLREAQLALTLAERGIADAATDIGRLSRDGGGATRAHLAAARDRREMGFETLRASLDGTSGDRRAGFDAVRSLAQAVDVVTDQLLTDTERSARLETAQERLAAAEADRERAASLLAAGEHRRAEIETAWRSLWAGTGISPHAPAAMARWRERVVAILNRRGRLAERRAEVAAVAAGLEASRVVLGALLAEHGRVSTEPVPAEMLFREARARLEGLQSAWTDAAARTVARKRAARDLAESEASLERIDAALTAHEAAWPSAVATVGLAATASLGEAEAALAVWQTVAAPRQGFEREGRSVTGIEQDLAAFDADVAAVATAVATDLVDGDAQETLRQLTGRLSEAKSAADARLHLRQAAGERNATRAVLTSRRDAVAAILTEACSSLGAAREGLASLLDRLARRQALELERVAASRDIAEIADGLDEARLREEQAGLDVDQLPSEIERIGLRQRQLLAEVAEASAVVYQAKRDCNALALGRDAAAAARERTEAGAELLSIAERWVVREAAARLAARAIDRHRAAVQDPLIERAGALFSIATAEAFSGLGADYDDADRPVLVARRAGGSHVPVIGLSEGTRDQLFLSLRLALLERRTAESLPFIGDDLLASFDEARTARTLALLADFGSDRQVVLFTHHRHVAELATAIAGGVSDIIDL